MPTGKGACSHTCKAAQKPTRALAHATTCAYKKGCRPCVPNKVNARARLRTRTCGIAHKATFAHSLP
eukprot:2838656-Alexandrium_andersonii.AAC.1